MYAPAMARIALIGTFSLIGGCAVHETPTLQDVPAPNVAEPTPSKNLGTQHTTYSVPTNTTDPALVERGVREWLSQHPAYAGSREAAVLRRMRMESGFRPCIRGGPHHYLLQWRSDRLSGLYKHAGVRPGICPSWLAQIEYMDAEIRSDPVYAAFLHTGPKNAYYTFAAVYLGGRP